MTKVKRYHLTETGLVEGESLGRLSVVLAADFDAAVEQIAQLEQLNALGQETVTLGLSTSARLVAERDALQLDLTKRDERVDVLETALKKISARCAAYIEAEREMPEPSVEVCQMIADAALKPAEVEPYKPFLSADRQPGTPVTNNLHCGSIKPAEGGGDGL